MMFRPTSLAVNCKVAAMCLADAHKFATDSGTRLGLDVVPEVCSTMATSPACDGPPLAAGASPVLAPVSKLNCPAAAPSATTSSMILMPSLLAAATAGDVLARSTISALACKSVR